MGRQTCVATIVIVGVMALAGEAWAANNLILSGRGVGGLRLGMTLAEVEAVMGQPNTADTQHGVYIWTKYYGGQPESLYVIFTKDAVRIIMVADRHYVTVDGLHVGSPKELVLGVMGEPCRRDRVVGAGINLVYSEGIVFGIGIYQGQLVVREVTIFSPDDTTSPLACPK